MHFSALCGEVFRLRSCSARTTAVQFSIGLTAHRHGHSGALRRSSIGAEDVRKQAELLAHLCGEQHRKESELNFHQRPNLRFGVTMKCMLSNASGARSDACGGANLARDRCQRVCRRAALVGYALRHWWNRLDG